MRIRDAVVVITGASSGIGKATALAFAERGARLVLAARREDALRATAEECEARGAETLIFGVDVTEADRVEDLAAAAVSRFGRIDVWVNDAAVTLFASVLDAPLDGVRRVFDVNAMGYLNGARAALPRMCERGQGVLINVASIVGAVAQPYTAAYGMSKAAVRSLSASLRQELRLSGHRGVEVCTLLPATMDTPLFQHAANRTGRQVRPMPPVSSPDRAADAIVSLARRPRRELVCGSGGRPLMMMHRKAPGLTERLYAGFVDRTHLSRWRPAADTDGNLLEPADAKATATVTGGWGGDRRTVRRRLAAAAVLGTAGALAVRTGLRRRLPSPGALSRRLPRAMR